MASERVPVGAKRVPVRTEQVPVRTQQAAIGSNVTLLQAYEWFGGHVNGMLFALPTRLILLANHIPI
jgi:hypothetical protein